MITLPRYPFTYEQLDRMLGSRFSVHLPKGRNLTLRRSGNYIEIHSYRTPIVVLDKNTITISAYGYSNTTNRHANALNLWSACNYTIDDWVVIAGTSEYPLTLKDNMPVFPQTLYWVLSDIKNLLIEGVLNFNPPICYVALHLYNKPQKVHISAHTETAKVTLFKCKEKRQVRQEMLRLFSQVPLDLAYLTLNFNNMSAMQRLSLLNKHTNLGVA